MTVVLLSIYTLFVEVIKAPRKYGDFFFLGIGSEEEEVDARLGIALGDDACGSCDKKQPEAYDSDG